MLHFDRNNVSEETAVKKKTSPSKECDICHYWYFLNRGFQFQQNVCNRSHDLFMKYMNLSDATILNIKVSHYLRVISGISKNKATNVMQNADLTGKSRTLSNIKIHYQI